MKQKWFEGRSDRQVLQYTVSHLCLDFDFTNRLQLLLLLHKFLLFRLQEIARRKIFPRDDVRNMRYCKT